MNQLFTKSPLFLYVLFFLFTFTACQKEEEPPVAHVSQEEFSAEDQRIIGLRLKETVLSDAHNFPILSLDNDEDNEMLNNYLNSLLRTLAITVPVENRNHYEWSIHVIDNDEETNVFATPGGHFFVYSGLLKSLESEAELMAILAHEIMYVDQDLLIFGLKDAFGGKTLGDILLGKAISDIENMALFLRDIRFSEEQVLNADAFAVDVMCPFLFNAGGLRIILDRISNSNELELIWLEKRPSASNRDAQLAEYISKCGTAEQVYAERYQEMVAKLP